jgi:hypothetical protein
MDVYCDISRTILVDINPWGEFTSPKLFSWEELNLIPENSSLITRVVENEE